MPPRKSASRKSDTANARLVPVEAAVLSPTAVTPIAPAPAPAPVTEVPIPPQPQVEKKDKDKEKESPKEKDKESQKEKDKSKDHNDAVTIEDLTLPRSIITRLAKGVLPPNTQIQANAVLALSNSATMFISYLASHANDHTLNAGKKTVTPADVFKALEETEFSFLREPLEAEFAKFNAVRTEKRTSYRKKVQAKKSDGADTDMADTSHVEADGDTTIASEASGPRSKRARVNPGAAPEVDDDAETEDEEPVPEDDEPDEVEEEEEEEEEDEAGAGASGDDTHDALEEREGQDDADEALDGDESD